MKSSKSASKAEAVRELLTRGVVDVIERAHLEKALRGGKKLRIKLGIDPTSPDLHLGNAVVLRKLKQFQDAGHKVVFIIGDFTAQIGDPSDQRSERKALSKKEIERNMKNYLSQAGKIINTKKAEIRYNSEWLGGSTENLLELTKAATINQVSDRADFKKRIEKGQKVSLMEALYALLQGYDSVMVKADVELGGTDQLLNLLMGRQIQRHFKMKEQDVLTVPLLEGTDGVRKMSKSYGNYIGISDKPKDMFGKVMSIKDALIGRYFELCTDVLMEEVQDITRDMKLGKINPRDAKARLAWEIVRLYYGEKEADMAEEEFVRVFRRKEMPKRIPTLRLGKKTANLVDILTEAGAASSKSEARRLIEQGAVRVNERQITDQLASVNLSKTGTIFRVGKKTFFKAKEK